MIVIFVCNEKIRNANVLKYFFCRDGSFEFTVLNWFRLSVQLLIHRILNVTHESLTLNVLLKSIKSIDKDYWKMQPIQMVLWFCSMLILLYCYLKAHSKYANHGRRRSILDWRFHWNWNSCETTIWQLLQPIIQINWSNGWAFFIQTLYLLFYFWC